MNDPPAIGTEKAEEVGNRERSLLNENEREREREKEKERE
jgi:hypothetical protein